MKTWLNELQAKALYYGKAAAHTFWQAALASLVLGFGGSGLDVAHLTDISVWQKIVFAAVIAGLGAVASFIKQLVVLPAPGSVPAQDTADVDDQEVQEVVDPHSLEMEKRLAGTHTP